jgi:hypothetical protein
MHRYSDLRRSAVDFVSEFSAAGSVLVLALVRAAAEEVALAACGSALLGVRRFALREFVLDLSAAELNRRGLVPVGRSVREALAARVTAEALQRGELTYLRPVARFPGFPRALTATFEELRAILWKLSVCAPAGIRSRSRSPSRRLHARTHRAWFSRPRQARRSGARRFFRRL